MKMTKSNFIRRVIVIMALASLVFTSIPNTPQHVLAATKEETTFKSADHRKMNVGDTYDFDLKNKEEGARYKWISSDTSVATVSKLGLVKALAKGTATITCKITKGDKIQTLTAIVYVVKENKTLPSKIEINNKISYMAPQEIYDLNRTFTAKEAYDYVNWTSNDTNVATVDKNGVVTAIAKGNVTITVKGLNSNVKDSVKIKVTDNVVASTQKDIDRLLKAKNVSTIHIQTMDDTTLTIPAGDYSSKTLIVKAPNATISNYGVFKEINIPIKMNTWLEYAKNHIILFNSANVVIAPSANVVLDIASSNVKGNIEINGEANINVNKKSNINITGSTDILPKITVNAEGTILGIQVAVELTLNKTTVIDLKSQEAADKSKIIAIDKTAMPTVLGNISLKVSVDGKMQTITSEGTAPTTPTPTTPTPTTPTPTTPTPITPDPPTPTPTTPDPTPTNPPVDSYHLVWEDEFDGTTLNMDDWNYERREPGWVNNELQEYTDSTDNIYVQDGKLVIKANKTEKDGNISYTSGKVTTQNKHDFKYGKFEISAKAVEGQGLWPAIWMMPRNENFYGQWPRCGELDIMEVLGHEPNKSYATIHYGNPHNSQQGTYVSENKLSDSYHVYGMEWEPSEIRFYVDGNLVKTVNDWFSNTEGVGKITYPAPFDQPFYLQFNLAVGGNWPGNPNETTDFDKAAFMIDYVKVYQKDSYDENVTPPEKPPVELRNPDDTGNYIVNGDFSKQENLSDDIDWGMKYTNDGSGETTISNGQMVIGTTKTGTVDYSVQVVQPNLPLQKGGQYKLTFDAYADEARTMIVDISGPDKSYIRYFNDTSVSLTTEKQSYSYDFTMTADTDANGRLEYNLGNQGSTATVYISNVKLIKTGEIVIPEPEKSVLADGNYVYNGKFQEGLNRMAYWTVSKKDDVSVSVTNMDGCRELKVVAPEGITKEDVLVQQYVAISPNKEYELSFSAYSDQARIIDVRLAGDTFTASLTTEKQTFKYTITTSDPISNKDLVFVLGNAGITYIDDVVLTESGLLKNGDFTGDFTAWSTFVDGGISSKVSYTVDALKENYAAAFEIKDTGDAEWKIQLMQDNIPLENGKWYKLTFRAKTDLVGGRELQYAIQHNGGTDNDWTPYSGTKFASLNSEYQTYEVIFLMGQPTDEASRLSFSMGAVNGRKITDTHNIYIDDVTLEETTAKEPDVPVIKNNMLTNVDPTTGVDPWEKAVTAPGAATITTSVTGAAISITNVGELDWNVQLKQKIAGLTNGHTYQLKMNVKSDVPRTIKVALMTSGYDWYGGADLKLEAGENSVDIVIPVTKATSDDITFFISMGKIAGEDTPVGNLEITDIWLEDITDK